MSELDLEGIDLLSPAAQEAKPSPSDDDALLADLFGNSAVASANALPPVSPSVGASEATALVAPQTESVQPYTWLSALHLVPQHVQLIRRYPAIGLMQHDRYGLVLMAAYLEDIERRIRRNLKLGDDMFFYAQELELTEPPTKAFRCRIVVKTLPHRVGMRIRFWENGPQGDVLGKSGVFEVRETGLSRISGAPKAKR